MPLNLKEVHQLSEILPSFDTTFAQPMVSHPFLDVLKDRVMVFDGGMGTQIFNFNLSLKDFWDKENCVDVLVLSRPDVIQEIHRLYYEAGADCVETDTFGASKIVLAEFGLEDRCYEINKIAVTLARKAAESFQDGKQRFVAGS